MRCLEIRGHAEAIAEPVDSAYATPLAGADTAIIRIHPERIISFGITEPDRHAHELTINARDVS